MSEKDNELDIILNQYSDKINKNKASSLDELDELLGTNTVNDNSADGVDEASEDLNNPHETSAEDTDDISEETAENSAENEDSEAEEEASEQENEAENEEDLSSVSADENFTQKVDLTDSGIAVKSGKTQEKEKKPKKKKKKSKVNSSIFVALIVVCVVLTVSFVIAVFGINLGMEYLGVGKKDVQITINIPSGSNSDDITKLLKENGLIDNELLFKLTLKLKKAGGSLKPGDVTLKPVMGYDSIIEALCETRESYDQVTITFTEGMNLRDIAMLLQENGVCSSEEFIYEFNTEKFGYDYENAVTTSAEKFYKYEGFFFPDTYSFYVDDSAYNITKIMRAQLEKVFVDNNLYSKIEASGFTIEEVITLASVVQAEAATPEDMKNVASVFINRLKKPNEFPKLQSDATDNYFEKVIAPQSGDTTSLAMFEDAYNTYVRKGLPAGAVGNPGLDAILAVVDAPNTNYYYFCSNLETKECFYAETLEEHTENLKKAGLQ